MGAQAVRLSNVDIDNALKDKDFEVLFQPIFDLGNGALARVETFVRWRHASLGVLPPGAFISFFETQGRMSELTRYVLNEALSAYQSWRGSNAPGFSINLALSDLSDESFASHFTVLLRERGFPAELVTLECPMPQVDADIATIARQLQRLAETGARLAIEVRGRANDFLKTIEPFPFAEIKTGGAAILRFARTVRGPGLSAISELLELAAKHNAAISAVGVEDQASLSALRGLGFAAAQGNHLGKVGALNAFMPSHVNDVRALLGLEALSSDDLAALFRTGAPKFAAAAAVAEQTAEAVDVGPEPARAAQPEIPDDLVERLAARIAKTDGGPRPAPARARSVDPAEKAAAIARARRKTLIREKLASRNALKEKAAAHEDRTEPREMQERLSREFESLAQTAPRDAGLIDPGDGSLEDAGTYADNAPIENEPTMTAAGAAAGAQPIENAAGEAHMSIEGARARFSPTLRVGAPEARPADFGDLNALEATEAAEIAPVEHAAPPPATPTEDAVAEAVETAIPDVATNAKWVEDVVAIEAQEPPAAKRQKGFLSRTVVPYRALKITHFWPRARKAKAAAE